HLVRKRRARHREPHALEPLADAMQAHPVAVLLDDDLRDQRRAVDAAGDDLVAEGAAHDRTVALTASEDLADVSAHEEVPWLVVEHLVHFGLERRHRRFAVRAVSLTLGYRQGIVDARQRRGQLPSLGPRRGPARLFRPPLEVLVEVADLRERIVAAVFSVLGGLDLGQRIALRRELVEQERQLALRQALAMSTRS